MMMESDGKRTPPPFGVAADERTPNAWAGYWSMSLIGVADRPLPATAEPSEAAGSAVTALRSLGLLYKEPGQPWMAVITHKGTSGEGGWTEEAVGDILRNDMSDYLWWRERGDERGLSRERFSEAVDADWAGPRSASTHVDGVIRSGWEVKASDATCRLAVLSDGMLVTCAWTGFKDQPELVTVVQR